MHRAWRPAVLDLRISQRNNGSQWRATWACVYVCICFTHVLPKRPRSVCEMLSYSATSSFLVSCMLSLSSVTQLWTVTAFLSTTDWLKGELCGGGGGEACSFLLLSALHSCSPPIAPTPPFHSPLYNSLAHTSPCRCALSSLGRWSTKLRSLRTSLQWKSHYLHFGIARNVTDTDGEGINSLCFLPLTLGKGEFYTEDNRHKRDMSTRTQKRNKTAAQMSLLIKLGLQM